jgi:hypothetical protein
MRLLATAAALSMLALGAAQAQDATVVTVPPKLFTDAGYAQHDITPGLCRNVSAPITECTIPAMTVGRYLIEVTGTSTAQAADAVQQITVQLGDTGCQASRRGTTATPWAVGAVQTFRFDCVVTVMTDRPITVRAVYADFHATKDPKGPGLSLRKMPWSGVLSATGVTPQQ